LHHLVVKRVVTYLTLLLTVCIVVFGLVNAA